MFGHLIRFDPFWELRDVQKPVVRRIHIHDPIRECYILHHAYDIVPWCGHILSSQGYDIYLIPVVRKTIQQGVDASIFYVRPLARPLGILREKITWYYHLAIHALLTPFFNA